MAYWPTFFEISFFKRSIASGFEWFWRATGQWEPNLANTINVEAKSKEYFVGFHRPVARFIPWGKNTFFFFTLANFFLRFPPSNVPIELRRGRRWFSGLFLRYSMSKLPCALLNRDAISLLAFLDDFGEQPASQLIGDLILECSGKYGILKDDSCIMCVIFKNQSHSCNLETYKLLLFDNILYISKKKDRIKDKSQKLNTNIKFAWWKI